MTDTENPTYGDMLADRQERARVKAAEKFARDFPELAAQQEAEARAAAQAPAPVPVVMAAPAPAPTSNVALDAEVAKWARQGYTVTDRTPGQVILQRKQKIGAWRILIFVLLAITIIGLFLIPLIARALSRKMETVVVTVDASGKVRSRTSKR